MNSSKHGRSQAKRGAGDLPTPAAASPPGSCPRGGAHRGRASPYGQGGAKGRVRYPASSRRPCHKRAIHSSPERSPSDNHGQPRTTTEQPRPAPFAILAGDSSARTGFGSRGHGSTNAQTWTSHHPAPSPGEPISAVGSRGPIVLSVQLGHTYRNGCSFNRCARLVGGGSSWDRSAP
jgi:hypothetical protein